MLVMDILHSQQAHGNLSYVDTASVKLDAATEYTAWTTLPQTDRDRVWVNVVAANGMYKDDGGKSVATTDFALEIGQLSGGTPTGYVETVTGSLSGSVTEERAITIEHTTSWIGEARVRMRRTTAYDYLFQGTIVDEVKWVDLYSVSPLIRKSLAIRQLFTLSRKLQLGPPL